MFDRSKVLGNIELSNLLRNVAAAYQIKDKEKYRFQIIAYERAADAVEHLSSEAKDLYDDGKLDEIPGIGKSIGSHLGEIFSSGRSKHFDKLFEGIPDAVFELIPIDGIGPKTAVHLVEKLKITSHGAVKKLLKLAKMGMVKDIEGFGEESQENIIKSIGQYSSREKRHLLNYAQGLGDKIIKWMKKDPNVKEAEVLGSLRRKTSTIGDVDIGCATVNAKATIEHFCSYEKTTSVLERGGKTASVILPGNVQIDLMVAPISQWGSVLQHFTGSKHHNIALREYAGSLSPSLSLSEYGIRILNSEKRKVKSEKREIRGVKDGKDLKEFRDEVEFYKFLGMDWIPPELRENTGEINAAIEHTLPDLVELKDIKGDLQIHSNFDTQTSHDLGMSETEEIIKNANRMGYEYIALTDHNPSTGGHSDQQIYDILARRRDWIEQYNYSINKNRRVIYIFNSLEIDILPDGTLPISDKNMDILDFALVSIHSSFKQKRSEVTKRVIQALSHKKVKIMAHPSGRKINEREGVDLDWDEVFEFCRKNNKYMEINAGPMRLDLPDHLVKEAVKKGVLLTTGTDAHHADHMMNMGNAINVARRGWAQKNNILTTKTYDEIKKCLIE